jgi:hypothetical protein
MERTGNDQGAEVNIGYFTDNKEVISNLASFGTTNGSRALGTLYTVFKGPAVRNGPHVCRSFEPSKPL